MSNYSFLNEEELTKKLEDLKKASDALQMDLVKIDDFINEQIRLKIRKEFISEFADDFKCQMNDVIKRLKTAFKMKEESCQNSLKVS